MSSSSAALHSFRGSAATWERLLCALSSADAGGLLLPSDAVGAAASLASDDDERSFGVLCVLLLRRRRRLAVASCVLSPSEETSMHYAAAPTASCAQQRAEQLDRTECPLFSLESPLPSTLLDSLLSKSTLDPLQIRTASDYIKESTSKGPMLLLHVLSSLGAQPFSLVRHSQLALADRRVLLTAPRVEVGPLSRALIEAGARPIWYPAVRISPLSENEAAGLDDALMRLTDYDVLLITTRHALDAIAQRGTMLGDGDASVLEMMLRASGVEVATIGSLATAVSRSLRSPATVVPYDTGASGMADLLEQVASVQ